MHRELHTRVQGIVDRLVAAGEEVGRPVAALSWPLIPSAAIRLPLARKRARIRARME